MRYAAVHLFFIVMVATSPAHAWDQQVDAVGTGYLKDVALAPSQGPTPWRIVALDGGGVAVLDAQGQAVSTIEGRLIERVDAISTDDQVIVAAPEEQAGIHLWSVDQATGVLSPWMGEDSLWPVDFAPVVACLAYDPAEDQRFVFAATERGTLHHYRIVDGVENPSLRRIRTLDIGGEITSCSPGAGHQWLYVAEPGVGVWRLGIGSEAERIREPVAFVAPFGRLDEAVEVSVGPGGMLSVLGEDNIYFLNTQGGAVLTSQPVPAKVVGAEGLSIDRNWMVLAVEGDEREGGGRLFSTALPGLQFTPAARPPPVAKVRAVVETDPVASAGDAADDPAVWIHPEDATNSLILGTDKQAGLYVYDLAGDVQQFLPAGKVNNVDVRYGFELADGTVVDIAVATNRSHGTLTIWGIDRASGELTELGAGQEDLAMNEPYGLCLYQNPEDNAFFAVANSKAGEVEQHRLIATDDARITAEPVRSFEVGSITEGCVVDDAHHQLFIGEETRGIWAYDARPDRPASQDDRALVDAVAPEGRLTADIEGLALYLDGSDGGYLVASVQGANQFALYDRQPPHVFQGFFEIVADPASGIDGVSETDGLEVVSRNLGPAFTEGLIVVQDGRNVEPTAHQNFKLVPWTTIAESVLR
jgi:3-phytase